VPLHCRKSKSIPDEIILLRSQLCDDLISQLQPKLAMHTLSYRQCCKVVIGLNGGPRNGFWRINQGLFLTRDNRQAKLTWSVGISQLYFDSRCETMSFLNCTKIRTSEFPTRPVPRQMTSADMAKAVARSIPSATDIATTISGALTTGYRLLVLLSRPFHRLLMEDSIQSICLRTFSCGTIVNNKLPRMILQWKLLCDEFVS
jgi:hypothetical protein